MINEHVSVCCEAPVTLDPRHKFYVCSKCGEGCALKRPPNPVDKDVMISSKMRINNLHSRILEVIGEIADETGEQLSYAEIMKTFNRIEADLLSEVLQVEREHDSNSGE